MSKDLLAFCGTFAAAFVTGLFTIIVKWIEIHKPPNKTHHTDLKLNPFGIVAMTVWPLAGLVSLAIIIWLPGPNDGWFFEIHKASVIVATVIGVFLLLAMLRHERRRSVIPPQRSLLVVMTIVSTLYFIVLCSLGWRLSEWISSAPSTKLVIAGFSLLNSKDYERAIAVAGECTSDFHFAATRLAKSLDGQEMPTGDVTLQQKSLIFSHGPLNDVGACYWIAGVSAQKLNRIDEAKAAYKEALAYRNARVWDHHGWFWSPAEDAEDRLAKLRTGTP